VSAALSSFSLSFTCSVFALLAIHCSRNALMQEASPRPLDQLNSLSTRKGRRKSFATPESASLDIATLAPARIPQKWVPVLR
jgi:hypothetical protein